METLKLDLGTIRLAINGDENRIIEFNPNDLNFVNKLYELVSTIDKKGKEYDLKDKPLKKQTELDKHGIPVNLKKRLDLTTDFCKYLRKEVDVLFGEGTSQIAFGDLNTMNMFEQLLNGVTPFIKDVRSKKTDKYLEESKGVMKE